MMRYNPLRIFQMKGRTQYYWKTNFSVTIVTVEYTRWKPWPPTPANIDKERGYIQTHITYFNSDEIQTAKDLEEKLGKYISDLLGPNIKILVRYGGLEAKPKN